MTIPFRDLLLPSSNLFLCAKIKALQNDAGKPHMKTKLQIIFYSMYGHIFRMTEAVAEGAKSVKDVEVEKTQAEMIRILAEAEQKKLENYQIRNGTRT